MYAGGRLETVSGAADRLDEGRLAGPVYLVAQVADVYIDDVRSGIEGEVPDGGKYLLAGEDLTLEQRELAARKVNGYIPAPDPTRAEIHLQVAGLEPRRPRLVGGAPSG